MAPRKTPLRLAILSRNKNLHSIRRLAHESRKLGIEVTIINPLDCQLVVAGVDSKILIGPQPLAHHYDAVLPRIGASITEYGLAVVKQFESMGMEVINGSRSIADSRDKLRCLQILSRARLRVPPTVLNRSSRGLKAALQAVGGTPVVLKLIQGTQGVGVMLLQTPIAVKSVLDTIWGLEKDVILQQFIAEGAGRDYRAFVVGGQVVAAMMRTAPEGEFRSNIHRGGEGRLVRLPRSYKRAAIESARILGLDIAGVDLMEGPKGPLILEVNSSPGFEGIERATGLNIASQIIKHIVKKAQIARRRKKRRR